MAATTIPPTPTSRLPAPTGSVLAGLLARAPSYERWLEQVKHAGYCERPVRLAGVVDQADTATGELRRTFTTEGEPDATLLVACGNRRATRCRPCSAVYRADAYQLVRAGLAGGKGVGAHVAGHPRVFATFTAPSFGPVHTHLERDGTLLACHPRDNAPTCAHGRPACCFARHQPDDPMLGQPLCAGCFDYAGLVAWNALAPELWRRTMTYLRRELARKLGLTRAQFAARVRVSYVKVAEYQRRGAVHYHAVIRLDGRDPANPDQLTLPPAGLTAAVLVEAVEHAATDAVLVRLPGRRGEPGPVLAQPVRWGEQVDAHPIPTGPPAERTGPGLDAGRVAGYVAKYATKATEAFGPGLDRPLKPADLDRLDASEHAIRLVRACWQLAADPALGAGVKRRWAHQLGYGGHVTSKSRRYSTTMTALRKARRDHARATAAGPAGPRDAWGRPLDPAQVEAIGRWAFVGAGYDTPADWMLARTARAQHAEMRRIAREELSSSA